MYCPVCHSDYPADWKACPKDATHLLKSAQIGKYRIEGLLGVGGMGAVYRASNPDTKGRVAIKVMNPAVAGAESARARFQREAASVAALRTTHVVKVYDFGTEPDGTLYLVMELMDGHTLREEIVPAPDYMDLARVQMVMDGALKGLAAAHRAGIVHRDLKPENVFVADTDDGEVPKLLDFGIARVRTRDADLTRTGSLMGTASYMASEQIVANVGEIGSWSDVYAMGAILYEMLAGTPAYGGSTVTEVLQRVLKAEVVPLATIRSGLPDAVYALVERCMSQVPATRPQDAEAMRIALNAARLVPSGTAIPPPHKTRVDSAPPVAPHSSDVGMMATEGRDTPVPVHRTPQPGAFDQRNEIDLHAPARATSGSGSNVAVGSTPSGTRAGIMPARGSAPQLGAGTGDLGASGSKGALGTGDVAPANRRSMLPYVLGFVAVAGVAGFLIVRSMKSEPAPAASVRDANVADAVAGPEASVAAPPPIDATVAAGAAHDDMVWIDGGTGLEIGSAKATGDALRKQTVALDGFWIDRNEMTRGQLEIALGAKLPPETKLKIANDAATTSARFVDWAAANAACVAAGKRLPTEPEWEVAARTTPQDAAKAKLLRKGTEDDLVGPPGDCSAAGLCDMLGGLHEWTSTPKTAGTMIVRGASYKFGQAIGSIHARIPIRATTRDNALGFRCAVSKAAKGAKGE